jgi:hypothetical protein
VTELAVVDWAMENALLGASTEELIDALTCNGMESDAARTLVTNLDRLPGYTAAHNLAQQYLKLQSVMALQQQLLEQDKLHNYVPRVSGLTRDKFFTDVWMRNRPVIITDFLANSPAYKNWTFDHLAERFGDDVVEVQTKRDSDPDYEYNAKQHKEKMPMRDFVQRIKTSGPTNDFYMTCNNQSTSKSRLGELLNELTGLPKYVNGVNSKTHACNFWIGPKGTHTPLHHDVCIIIHAHFHGRKRWQLIHPNYTANVYNSRHVFSDIDIRDIDYDRFPMMRDVPILDVVVEEGEALFVPLSWWHAVTSLSPCISMTFTGFPFPNHWNYHYPTRRS